MKKHQNNYAFIDSQNVNLAIRAQGWKLDWRRFRVYLRDKYGVGKAFLFIGFHDFPIKRRIPTRTGPCRVCSSIRDTSMLSDTNNPSRQRLLITTQAVDLDEPALANFHRWLIEFAKQCESIEVICLKEGRHALPGNVHIHSLGKTTAQAPANPILRFVARAGYVARFYRYLWTLRGTYDAVFVHMNPEYVLLAGFWWRMRRKRIVMWYVHRQSSLTLRVAVHLVNTVCTTARESISVSSRKIAIMGHGIDVDRYAGRPPKAVAPHQPRIVSVGRITPIKNLEIIVDALAKVREAGIEAHLDLVGVATVASDNAYENMVRDRVRGLHLDEAVWFLGAIKNDDMPEVYPRYDLSINACPTGGIDKAVLESMASGTIPLVCNVAFRDYFGELADDLIFEYRNPDDLAKKILALLARTDLAEIQIQLRTRAREKADVTVLIRGILAYLGWRSAFRHPSM